MSIYFQRERKHESQLVEAGEKVLFDVSIRSSETIPGVEENQAPLPPEPDFEYHADGTVDLFRASTFIVTWSVATSTGLATDGQTFQLRKRDYEAEVSAVSAEEIWVPVGDGHGTFKTHSNTAMTIVLVSEAEIKHFEKATIALFNVADDDVVLTHHNHSKAGIVIFGIGPVDSDISDLYTFVQELYSFISYSDVHVYNCSNSPFFDSSHAGAGAGVLVPLSNSPDTYHYQVGVIWSGYTYNFWLISPNHPNPASPRTISFPSGNKTYLLRSSNFEPLGWYQGQATFGTMWCLGSNGNYTPLPVMFDTTGIYVEPTNNSFSSLSNVKFTQTLILTPPEGSGKGLP